MDNQNVVALTEAQIAANKERYLHVMEESGFTKRAGAKKLLEWMEGNTDFFAAPASTRFHEPYAGGLCEHSLCVYDKLVAINNDPLICPERVEKITPESLAVMALLHDLCKANFYKVSTRNVKDETTGKWEKVPFYTVEDQFPMGHGEKSVFLVERFVRLKTDEAIAIRWHMGGYDDACRGGSFSCGNAYEMYPHAAMLNLADMMATYLK
jgi:hypothetical protein